MTDRPARHGLIKALTVIQPYAELIASGEKTIENRRWATNYRGPLAIHAGKSKSWLEDDELQRYPAMTFGAIVAMCRLCSCVRLDDLPLDLRDSPHAEGPWCWVLADIQRLLRPVPCRGAQGLWEWKAP